MSNNTVLIHNNNNNKNKKKNDTHKLINKTFPNYHNKNLFKLDLTDPIMAQQPGTQEKPSKKEETELEQIQEIFKSYDQDGTIAASIVKCMGDRNVSLEALTQLTVNDSLFIDTLVDWEIEIRGKKQKKLAIGLLLAGLKKKRSGT